MLLVKLNDGVPEVGLVTLENFLLLYPSTSFPGYLDASITEPLGFGIFTYMPQPEDYDKRTEKVVEALPVRNDETGVWEQQWRLEPLTEEEKQHVDNIKRVEVIGLRNAKLMASDWTQVLDGPLTAEKKAEWATYRQQLRDLPQTESFDPWSVQWPTPPQ